MTISRLKKYGDKNIRDQTHIEVEGEGLDVADIPAHNLYQETPARENENTEQEERDRQALDIDIKQKEERKEQQSDNASTDSGTEKNGKENKNENQTKLKEGKEGEMSLRKNVTFKRHARITQKTPMAYMSVNGSKSENLFPIQGISKFSKVKNIPNVLVRFVGGTECWIPISYLNDSARDLYIEQGAV